MVIKANLSREQFIRLSILRHFQRIHFYIFALAAAGLTAWALLRGPLIFLLAGWAPFLVYILIGVIGAIKDGRNEAHPVFLPTRYEFTEKGISISNKEGTSQLEWEHFNGWKMMVKCYVLSLSGGAILAIPQVSVPINQIAKFETLLRKHIGG